MPVLFQLFQTGLRLVKKVDQPNNLKSVFLQWNKQTNQDWLIPDKLILTNSKTTVLVMTIF